MRYAMRAPALVSRVWGWLVVNEDRSECRGVVSVLYLYACERSVSALSPTSTRGP